MKSNSIIKGTLILTAAGIISRILGFFYRIYLSRMIGLEGLGLYQMIFPLTSVCMAIAVSGISAAITKQTAGCRINGNVKRARSTLVAGIILSLTTQIVCSVFLYLGSDFIADVIYADERFASLIRIISFSLPVCVVHTCINSYYIGCGKPAAPAASQILEQLSRIACMYIIFVVLRAGNSAVTVEAAVFCVLVGEIASFGLCTFLLKPDIKDFKLENAASICADIYKTALPISANHIIISLLHSLEAILIPSMLALYGLSKSECISLYGILSGMAIPLIMLPSTLINSFSQLLLPAVAAASSQNEPDKLNKTVALALKLSLEIGIVCLALFYNYGIQMGIFLFDEGIVGIYVRAFAWMCPFLYISTTFSGIINGLGRAKLTLFMDVTAFLIRIALILILIPKAGMTGYLIAFLASEVLLAVLYLFTIQRLGPFTQFPAKYIIRPAVSIVPSIYLTRLFRVFWNVSLVTSSQFLSILVPCGVLILLYFAFLYVLFPLKAGDFSD